MSKGIGWVAKIVVFLSFCGAVGTFVYGIVTIIMTLNASIQLSSFTVNTTCTILEKHIDQSSWEGNGYPELYSIAYTPRFTFLMKISPDKTERVQGYDIKSQLWDISETHAHVVLDRFQIGQNYPCWYDPNNPSRAILTREYNFSPAYIFGVLLALESVGGIVWGRKLLWFSRRLFRIE